MSWAVVAGIADEDALDGPEEEKGVAVAVEEVVGAVEIDVGVDVGVEEVVVVAVNETVDVVATVDDRCQRVNK